MHGPAKHFLMAISIRALEAIATTNEMDVEFFQDKLYHQLMDGKLRCASFRFPNIHSMTFVPNFSEWDALGGGYKLEEKAF